MKRVLTTTVMALTLGACVGGASPTELPAEPTPNPVITIADMQFVDGTVTVEAGTTVTWEWSDAPIEHNVVFDGFESPLQSEGTYTRTFDEVGVYPYRCRPHATMTGTINVVPASP